MSIQPIESMTISHKDSDRQLWSPWRKWSQTLCKVNVKKQDRIRTLWQKVHTHKNCWRSHTDVKKSLDQKKVCWLMSQSLMSWLTFQVCCQRSLVMLRKKKTREASLTRPWWRRRFISVSATSCTSSSTGNRVYNSSSMGTTEWRGK